MARRLSIQLSDEVAARVEAEASRRGAAVDDVVRDALVEHLGWQAVMEIREHNQDLDENAALRLAYEELKDARAQRRPA